LALQVDFTSSSIGIIGCGNVGGRLLHALQGAGVKVVGFDPFLQGHGLPLVSFESILACDVICLHTPLTHSGEHPTFHLFDESVIKRIKPGAVLLNAGRGAVVDNRALLHRLQTRKDLRVVLDVWENEPAISAALLQRVAIGTPHIAGYSAEGKLRGTEMVYEALCDFLGCEKATVPIVLAGAVLPYDILSDDAALREQFSENNPAAFDRLRKHYHPRRECRLPVNGYER